MPASVDKDNGSLSSPVGACNAVSAEESLPGQGTWLGTSDTSDLVLLCSLWPMDFMPIGNVIHDAHARLYVQILAMESQSRRRAGVLPAPPAIGHVNCHGHGRDIDQTVVLSS